MDCDNAHAEQGLRSWVLSQLWRLLVFCVTVFCQFYHMGYVKRKSAREHAQNAWNGIIPHMRKVSSWPLLSCIHSVVSNDSVTGQGWPWMRSLRMRRLIWAFSMYAYVGRHVFACRGQHTIMIAQEGRNFNPLSANRSCSRRYFYYDFFFSEE